MMRMRFQLFLLLLLGASARAEVISPSEIWEGDLVAGVAIETGDEFGKSVTTGDFNGDGFLDMAVGAPGKNVHDVADGGAVFVFYGSEDGLVAATAEMLTQTDHIDGATSESDDLFGWVLASGDFDRDGIDDLAIGSPFENVGSLVDSGMVEIIYGAEAGLAESEVSESFSQTTLPRSINETGDHFGWSIAVGDFDGDRYDDLVIGVPLEDFQQQNLTDTGMMAVFYGSGDGVLPARTQEVSHDDPAGADNEDDDHFGWSLAVGDFDGNGFDDVAAGVPGRDISFDDDTGWVVLFSGTRNGLELVNVEYFSQEELDGSSNEDGDQFGWALAAGDFDGDGIEDLAVGIPSEDAGVRDDTGAVGILYGDVNGLGDERSVTLTQEDAGGENDREDEAGKALAVGDFDGDGRSDLLVGVPAENDRSRADAGAVLLFFGSGEGVVAGRAAIFTQEEFGGDQAMLDEFGSMLAGGDFDGDGVAEMIIGVPSELAGGVEDGGAVYVGSLGDTDGDGLVDVIEVGVLGTDPLLADTDGDGFDDGAEIDAGTDPLDAGSVMEIVGLAYNPGNADVTLTWSSAEGRRYFIEWSQDMAAGSWQRLNDGEAVDADSGEFSAFRDTRTSLSTERRYYRVVLER